MFVIAETMVPPLVRMDAASVMRGLQPARAGHSTTFRPHYHATLLVILILFAWTTVASGDELAPESLRIPQSGITQIITTTYGSSIVGHITAVGADSVTIEADIGIMTIPRERIRGIREVPEESIHDGVYWFPEPNNTRLFFAPTGRMISKGSGYVADYYLFFPSVNYGVTDRLSLGGGCSIFPAGGVEDQLFFFTPKFGIRQTDTLNLAAGALILRFPGDTDDDLPVVSVVYGVGTWGTTERSVTVGVGYGMVDLKLADRPMIVLGGERRISRRMAAVTENWMVPGAENILVSLGLRFMGEWLSVDLALINTIGKESIGGIGLPYLDFVYNF